MTTVSVHSRPAGFNTGTGRPGLIERVRRIFAYRRIMRLLVGRDLKVRYAGSALGYLWSVLEPLLMSLVYWFVFTKIFHRTVGYQPYIVFLLTGQLPWFWISNSINGCARGLRSEARMVRSSNVPREVWVLRVIASKGTEYLLSLPVLALFAVINLFAPHWQIIYMPVAMLMTIVLLTGMGLILAPLVVLVRDVERILAVFLRVLFYFSPTLYSVHNIPSHLHLIASLNPLAGILVLFRAAFFPQELGWNYVLHSAIGCVVIFVLGVFVFSRLERAVLKEI
ncbi:MAG: ABC transporter permease [Actinomycetota bacterium]|nr:ABC transporter permease [Actinomycetota bacterium]